MELGLDSCTKSVDFYLNGVWVCLCARAWFYFISQTEEKRT